MGTITYIIVGDRRDNMIHQMTENHILLQIIRHLKSDHRPGFQELIEELQPYDMAVVYKNLPEKHRDRFLSFLDYPQKAVLVQELEGRMQLEILQRLGIDASTQVMEQMDKDDLADLLSSLSRGRSEEFLASMKREESRSVKNLMGYPPESAGGIMTNRYVWILNTYTVKEAVDKLKAFADFAENIYYLYVLDDDKRLIGVVSFRDLLMADLNERVENIMFSRVIAVQAETDQEQAARLIERYDFVAVPVTDNNGRLLGIITVDDVLDVLIQEANEDIEKLTASGKAIDFETKALAASFRRLPWLIMLLFIGLFSASIINRFEDTLQKVVSLAFFMPMIAGMTGNTGTQSLAVVVRGLVKADLNRASVIRLVARETGVGVIIGVICGLLIAAMAFVWQGNLVLGMIVGGSLFLTLIVGTLAGTVIPLILYYFKVDPAIASGPLITTLNDIFSLSIYFGTASFFILYLT